MKARKKQASHSKKKETLKETGETRHPEFETPSQRRNRDGVGRGPNGSEGGGGQARRMNH
jgi:hypothetical protein